MLLGLQDVEVKSGDALEYKYLNMMGGDLVLPSDLEDAQPKEATVCDRCGIKKSLICQIYAPLDSSNNHRILAVFCCLSCPKENSFSCWRIEFPDKSVKISQEREDTFAVSDWGEDLDDWGTGSAEQVSSQLVNLDLKTELSPSPVSVERASVSYPTDSVEASLELATAEVEEDTDQEVVADIPEELLEIAKHSVLPQVLLESAKDVPLCKDVMFKPSFISVIDEEDIVDTDLESYRKKVSKQKFEDGEGSSDRSSGKNSGSGETYEKVAPAHGDVLTHKFLEVTRRCPNQILRYSQERGKGAILLADLQAEKVTCSSCGRNAVFEFQLMPYLAHCLEARDRKNGCSFEGLRLEFGTLLVFTCELSCWTASESFRREVIVYQPEPL